MTTQNAGRHAETIQDTVDEARIDYNALDNTLGGQLVQAGFIFAMLAARSAPVRLALGAANLAAVAVCNAFDEDPRNDLTARVDESSETASPNRTWAVLAGGTALLIGGVRLSIAVQNKLAESLRRRGAKRPHTLLGLGAAALLFAGTELQARVNAS